MPVTRFANMSRSDHSVLPPTPAVSMRFQSPNACNLCHTDKDAAWADTAARQWYVARYQNAAIERGELIQAARHREGAKAPARLAYLARIDNPIITTSLLRLLRPWDDPRKVTAYLNGLRNPSPLVRAAAGAGLADTVMRPDVQEALIKATSDDYRLVRIRAAASLAGIRLDIEPVRKATQELELSYSARPDDFTDQNQPLVAIIDRKKS